jgi:hypothetical protein
VLKVPLTALRTLGNTPKSIVDKLKGSTVHAILATSLCLDNDPSFVVWKAVLPSREDVTTSMPVYWPQDLQDLLPASATALLAKQKAKFERDWKAVSPAYPDLTRDDFLYSWLLINTRTFYHKTRATEKLPREDHMVLQPVADLFNHSPDGCNVAFDDHFFTISTTHDYARGDELFIRYGAHPNDFLLVEYGFTLPTELNPWDETTLDPYLCPLFSRDQRQRLEDAGFWAGYKLDAETVCYRTQIALRMLFLSDVRWRAVLGGERDEDEDTAVAEGELRKVLGKYEGDVKRRIAEVDGVTEGTGEMRYALRQRWLQIDKLVEMALARLERR